MAVRVVNQSPAFTLSAFDYNGEGEEILITWQDLMNSKVGDRWCARSGNTLRECITWDELEIIYKSENFILAINSWESIGTYPNYPVEVKARLILFNLNPEVKLEEEIKKIVKH